MDCLHDSPLDPYKLYQNSFKRFHKHWQKQNFLGGGKKYFFSYSSLSVHWERLQKWDNSPYITMLNILFVFRNKKSMPWFL